MSGDAPRPRRLLLLGALVTASVLGLTVLSRQLATPWQSALGPVVIFLGIFCVGLVGYLFAVHAVFSRGREVSWKAVIAFAILFRVVALFGEPLFDDDIFRYVWDGKVTLNGLNPYQHAPRDVVLPPFEGMDGDTESMDELDRLNELWFEHTEEVSVFQRINYPEVPTIYPPVAQGVFAFAYAVSPTPGLVIPTFKLVLTLFDVGVLLLIVAALKRLSMNPSLGLVYGWHPLVVKEIAGTGHMEAIPVFFIALGIYLLVTSRGAASIVALVLGGCAKLVPMLALPFVGIELLRKDKAKLLLGAVMALATIVVCYYPFADAGARLFAGTGAFARHWEMNGGLFELIRWGLGVLPLENPTDAAKIAVVLLLVGVIVFVWVRGADSLEARIGQVFTVLAAAYLLSPVQNPWYLCWWLPLLCFRYRWSWTVLSCSTVLYYLYYAIVMTDEGGLNGDVIGPVILVVQYLPFVVLLGMEIKRVREYR